MRRLIGLSLGVIFLAACGEMQESTPVDVMPEGGPTSTTTDQIQIGDGASGTQQGNPHFFFLPPVAESTPETGTPDPTLEPIVTLCHVPQGSSDCDNPPEFPQITFTRDASENEKGNYISVSDAGVYSVVWKTNDYPVIDLEAYKITVSIVMPTADLSTGNPANEEVELGWALTKAYQNQTYNSFQHTDGEGYIAISDNGNLNIKFIIDEDLLESEFCPDASSWEDCHVALFQPEESGCLEVFENPGETGQLPGSVACVPANGNPTVGGNPVAGAYAVVLTLEEVGVPASQGGAIDPEYQKPYFPDVATWPHGIVFDSESDGLLITICQRESEFESEDLLFEARPFLVFSGPGFPTRTVLPTLSEDNVLEDGEYLFDPTACQEEVLANAPASPSGPEGVFAYLTSGLSRVTNLFRPRPLVARRLHGGLNTKTYSTSPSGGEDAVAAYAGEAGVPLEGEEYEIGGGSVLDVNIDSTDVSIDPEEGLMLDPTTITVTPRNKLGEVIPFDVTVTVWVEGANEGAEVTITETTDGDGHTIYQATYTPEVSGDDVIHVAIDGIELPNASEYYVAPLSGVIEVYVEIDGSTIPAGDPDPAVGLPVVLYDAGGTELERQVTQSTGTAGLGLATFGSEASGDYLFGDYTISLPKRDFDFAFERDSNGDEIYEQDVTHSADPTIVTFSGSLMALPEGMHVYRIGAASQEPELYPDPFGTGNVYQYVEDTRSWVSAQNQIQYLSLADAYENVPAHMVTIQTAGENAFAASLVIAQCSGETDTKKCKTRGWIGLTDDEIDGSFEWVNNEGYLNPCAPSDPRPSSPFFFGWAGNEPSGRNNEDQVEIDLAGAWFDENGASSTNDGYITEFKAWQPQEDPPLTCSGS